MEHEGNSLPSETAKTTFYQNLSVPIKKVVNTIAVDTTGKYAALGGKKGLHIIDLDSPEESIKTLTQQSKWEVSVVEWNPHTTRKSFIASTANQNILIWNVEAGGQELQATIQTHERAVSDLSWSLFDANLLATCSADTYINLWDIRDPKKIIKRESFCGWTAGATCVKWNRFDPMTLASAHNGEVRIWDIRKVSSPVTFITAHMAKIYCLDWSYTDKQELVTSSEDKQVKFWNINAPRLCKATLNSITPVLKARYTPLGNGLMTVSARGDFSVRLWSLHDLNSPVRQFFGHTDLITAFDWRIKTNATGKKEYQLVTWSKDNTLRLWPIDPSIQESLEGLKKGIPVAKSKSLEDGALSQSNSPAEFLLLERTSSIGVKDLAQEFKSLEMFLGSKKTKNINISDMNLNDRQCTAIVSGVLVSISFPALYPNGAPPAFSFPALQSKNNSEPSKLPAITHSLNPSVQARITEELTETALSHVDNNQPCLYPCLCKLVLLLKEEQQTLVSDSDLLAGDGAPLSPHNPSLNNGASHNGRINLETENIPAPRTAGAVFGGPGKLFYFKSFTYNTHTTSGSHMGPRFRTYRELKVHINKVSNTSTLQNTDDSSFNLQTYFYPYTPQHDMTMRTSPLTLRSTGSIISNTQQLHQYSSNSLNSNFHIRDMSYLLPLDQTLGQLYTLSGSLQEICENNLAAAKQVERKDLIQLWSLVAIITHNSICNPRTATTHPMGRKMLHNIFNHYMKLRDVQTLAILSCVLTLATEVDPIQNSQSQSKTQKEDISLTHSNGISNPLAEPQSPSKQRAKKPSLLLDPELENSYDAFKSFYGEILYKWELLDKRSEVLKLVNNTTDLYTQIAYSGVCYKCEKPLIDKNVCSPCKVYGFTCAICHVAVRGICNYCMVCGHGGHTSHMAEWFKIDRFCPSGCGCHCLEENNWDVE